MIPLVWFLIAWFVLLGIFALLAAVTLFMHLRFGLTAAGVWSSSAIFLCAVGIVLAGSSLYLASVDWSQNITILTPSSNDLPGFNLQEQ